MNLFTPPSLRVLSRWFVSINIVWLGLILLAVNVSAAEEKAQPATQSTGNPQVIFQTSAGDIVIELFPKQAPLTVENFLRYVDDGFYNGVIFHRIVPGFVIQGGGFTFDFQQKATRAAIQNESDNKLKNSVGTLSMARTSQLDSATSQFFINTQNNYSLDASNGRNGYAVFGKVVKGYEVVKKIESEPRGKHRAHPEAPNNIVIIEQAKRIEPGKGQTNKKETTPSKTKASAQNKSGNKTSLQKSNEDK